VRRPRVHVVKVPVSGEAVTVHLIAESARKAGAEVVRVEAAGRDAESIAKALDPDGCDLLLTVGGSGVGRTDATVAALTQRGELIAHGLALQPGRTAAVGRIGNTPFVALPVFDGLSGRRPEKTLNLPLARKIASSVGIAEIALLQRKQGAWAVLAIGDLSLDAIARAEAWLIVPGSSEGFAAGAPVDGYMLRD
jgi:molybdopterin molybdotransferase